MVCESCRVQPVQWRTKLKLESVLDNNSFARRILQILLGLFYADHADGQPHHSSGCNLVLQWRPQHAVDRLQQHLRHSLPSWSYHKLPNRSATAARAQCKFTGLYCLLLNIYSFIYGAFPRNTRDFCIQAAKRVSFRRLSRCDWTVIFLACSDISLAT